MEEVYVEDETFKEVNFLEKPLTANEYENCIFYNCNFSNTNLSNIVFADCEFRDCNMSLAKLSNTTLRNIKFIGCKLLGLHFGDCKAFLFEVYFENSTLNLSSFYKLKLKNTQFINAIIREVDFTEADLTNSKFENCDLSQAVFQQTILEKVDFRSSYNYSIDPEINRIKKSKFSTDGLQGLLTKYDIEIE